MDRRGFLRFAGLAPVALMVRPAKARGAIDPRPFPTTEEEVLGRLAEIEREVGVGRDGTSSICRENGEPYITLACNHLGDPRKPEGKPATRFPTKEAAWALWFMAFEEYRRTRRGKIHWRKRPFIWECFDDNGLFGEERVTSKVPDGYIAFARLVIDD